MFNGRIRRGQRWLEQELEGGGRETLLHLAMGGILAPWNNGHDPFLFSDYDKLRALFNWAPRQPESSREQLESTIKRLPPRISTRQRRVLLREVATISHASDNAS